MSFVNDVINKLKKLPQDRLAQVAVALLLIYIASILANLSYLVIPGSHSGANISTPNRPASGQLSRTESTVNVGSITSMNLFGSYVKPDDKPKEVEPLPPQQDIPETTLKQLKLAATVAENNNSGKGTAIIQNGSTQSTYGIDDKIDGTTAIVRQVYTDRVIIQNGMRQETLMLDGVKYDRMNVAHKIDDGNTLAPNTDRYTPTKDKSLNLVKKGSKVDRRNDKKLTRQLAQTKRDIVNNPAKISELIRFRSEKDKSTNELLGFRLNPGKNPDLFKQAGFRPGDLAVEVNGRALNDLRGAMQVLRDLKEMTEANIVVERDGIRTEILFNLDSGPAPQNNGRSKSKGGLIQR